MTRYSHVLMDLVRQATDGTISDAEIVAALARHGFGPDDVIVNVDKILPDYIRALARIHELEEAIRSTTDLLEQLGETEL